MSVVQTVLVYVVIPLSVVAIVGALTLGPSAVRGQVRYRPGRPWTYEAAWWLPQPDADHPLPNTARAAQIDRQIDQGAAPAAVEAGAHSATAAQPIANPSAANQPAPAPTASVGGASGEW